MRKTYAAKLRTVLSASIASGRLAEDLNELTEPELRFLANDWDLWARDDQLPPDQTAAGAPWRVWLVLGGRGSGKTRAGAEWVRGIALSLVSGASPKGRRPPAVGDTFIVTAGCDKRFETCKTRFSNASNFRGFPAMPGNKFLTKVGRKS